MNKSNATVRKCNRTLLSCALGACLAMAAPAVLAQSTAATLRGQVSVDSAPAGDARITATNLATGLSRSVQAGANGSYNLAGLPPGTYRVDVTADGQASSRTVSLQVGQTATLNLGVGGVAETGPQEATDLEAITVTGTQLFETRTSEVATYVSQKQIEALPQSSRNFLGFADIVPGIVVNRSGVDETVSLRSGSQISNAVNVFIDGVGQKDYVLKGGVTGQDSTAGNPFPQLAVAEYKVITSNYKAEYDQLSSAAITAATKSGTNEFQGSFFWDYTSDEWTARTPAEIEDGSREERNAEQYGASFSGPIIRDQLHFFVTYEGKEIMRPRHLVPGRDILVEELPDQLQELARNTTSSPFNEDLWFGKLSWTPGDAHLFEFTAKRREEGQLNVPARGVSEYGTTRNGEETRLDLRHQYSADNWLNDAHVTYEDATFGPRPATIAPGYNLRIPKEGQEQENNPEMDVVLNAGGGPDQQDKGQKGYAFQNDFTWFGFEGHTIKAGIKYKKIDVSAIQRQPPNPQFRYDMNQSFTVPYEVEFTGSGLGTAGPVESENSQLGVYIQDDWEVNDHLTLNLGIRWDYEKTPSFEDHITPPDVVEALRNYAPINSPGVDYDYNDFISTGNNRSAFKDAWQPRVGFSYDINADQRHVIFGGAGRAYNRNQFDFMARESYGLAFQSYTYKFNTPGHDCTTSTPATCLEWDPAYFDQEVLDALAAGNPNRGTQVVLIDNEIKTPYSDQFSLGMRNAFSMFGHDWNSTTTLLHVLSHDGIIFSTGNRREGGAYFEPGWSRGNLPPADLPGFGRLNIGRNGVETRLNSLLLSLEKPYTQDSGWSTTIAYTYSDAKENRAGHDSFSFDYPSLDDVAFTRSIGVARHRLVATGVYDLGAGITLSGKLTAETPRAINSSNCIEVDTRNCFFDPYFPNTTIGFKQFDLAVHKSWDTGTKLSPWARVDVLNVFNWRNWISYESNRGSGRDPTDPDSVAKPNPDFGERNGLAIAYPTRTLKISMGFNW
ncbi:TonB-dependent receptor domain-containing protein [Luteimonas suaedae]|uniref:TonB-dependent receptor domain-containing protein n=1 Tax=Luteimonas suaedae TaxID=2605430 RepID=UPI0011EDBF59|nr:TonB-dependent receptor [Luteimonas suaedae]